MKELFDVVIDRKNTGSTKWDGLNEMFGTTDLLPLWVADMDFQTAEAVREAVQKRAEHGIYGYPKREDSYFEAITNWVKKQHAWEIERNWICTTPAVITALSIAIQAFTEPGDEIIIQPPVYPPFFSLVTMNNRVVVENPLRLEAGKYSMDFADLEAKLNPKVKALLLCSPHNPVGRVWTEAELQRLGKICNKHNIIIISDEMHADLIFKGHCHTPIARLSEELANRTVTFFSAAKTFNIGGFYNSYTVIPNETLRKRFQKVLDTLMLNHGNIFGIVALEAAYQQGQPWVKDLLKYLEENANYLVAAIHEKIHGIRVLKPEGTFVAWLDCNDLSMSPEALKDFFIQEAKVGVNDGLAFGQQGEGFVRLNFGCPRVLLEEAVERIAKAVAARRS